MKIDVRVRGIAYSRWLQDHAVRRIQFHLSRFGQELSRVMVRIVDINGPRGGVDKQVHITLRGPRVGTATIAETCADVFSAIDLAADRAARSVGRGLDRSRRPRAMALSLRGAR